MRGKICTLLAALAAIVTVGLSGVADASATTTLTGCQSTFHARPTSSGWYSDPCGARDYPDETFSSDAVRVQHYWSMSGGAHITDIRGTFTICSNGNGVRVSADAVALHRSDGVEYASSVQPQQVSTTCATMITVSKAVRGCGGTDNPAGPHAYWSYTEARGGARNTDGTLYPQPISGGYFTTPPAYFLTVVAGAAC